MVLNMEKSEDLDFLDDNYDDYDYMAVSAINDIKYHKTDKSKNKNPRENYNNEYVKNKQNNSYKYDSANDQNNGSNNDPNANIVISSPGKINIVEAYIKFFGKLIIFVSGMSGCGKTNLANNISRDFKLHLVNQHDYYKSEYQNKIEVPNYGEFNNLETHDSVDFKKLNEDINLKKEEGVVVSLHAFSDYLFDFKIDHHIHLKYGKKECNQARTNHIMHNLDDPKFKIFKDATEETIKTFTLYYINKYALPYYYDNINNSKINKFINLQDINDVSDEGITREDKIYDIAFEELINYIGKRVYNLNYNYSKNENSEKYYNQEEYKYKSKFE